MQQPSRKIHPSRDHFAEVSGVRRLTSHLKTYINEDSVHVILPTFNHFGVMLVSVCDRENPHLCGRVIARWDSLRREHDERRYVAIPV